MEHSYWRTCFRYLGMDDDEHVSHQRDQNQYFFICHPSTIVSYQPSTSQNPALSLSPNTAYNIVSFDSSDVERVPTIHQPYPKQESTHSKQFGSSTHVSSRRNQGVRKGRNSKSGTLDPVMAERKRRHDLAEKFIALSAIIPCLKKIDKASVLGGAVNYVKQLQQRIKELEEKANKEKSIEYSAIFTQRSSIAGPCTCGHTNININNVLPEVEARVLEREVLIRIRCKKQNGIVLNIMALLESTHLSVASSSVLPFGNSTLNITIIAQMCDEYSMTVNDLVKILRRDLFKLHEGAC